MMSIGVQKNGTLPSLSSSQLLRPSYRSSTIRQGNSHLYAMTQNNIDSRTVEGFGLEWTRFDQTRLPDREFAALFEQYFAILNLDALGKSSKGFDAGCGSGRWARGVAPRVGVLHCVDASSAALEVARVSLQAFPNCVFHQAGLSDMPFADGSMDFGYSLGVLHHLPNPAAGLKSCTAKLKRGAPFLLYMYYAFDDKPLWFRWLWKASDLGRRVISRCPPMVRHLLSDAAAAFVYWPMARSARLCEMLGCDVSSFPLAFYRHTSFYTMRTDALDRFGTRLEHRFTRRQIAAMMCEAGLVDIQFSDRAPYWCAVGRRA
jgi:SAM-dependent methyltransferase